MTQPPDYERLRRDAGFSWSAGSTYLALLEVTGIPIREFNLNPDVCIGSYRLGRPLLWGVFGEDVRLPGVATPPVSYGHVNGLGSRLTFPEGGEVAHEHIYDSLEEGVAALQKPVDFARAGMAPFFLEFREKLQRAFPDEPVGFSYGLEGPLTTAYELRGDGFFYDLMDKPDLVKRFLELVVDSILEFHRFRCAVLGAPAVNPSAGGLCDDLASMVPPRLFPEIVLPAWERYYRGVTAGARRAHVEDLRPEQLPFLEDIGLVWYDPSISPKLNPRLIAERCRVPFGWRLGNFHYHNMSPQDVEDFVFQAAADGASSVFTYVSATMTNEATVKKVRAFIRAAKEAKRLLDAGAPREALRERVSPEGREKFWALWPE